MNSLSDNQVSLYEEPVQEKIRKFIKKYKQCLKLKKLPQIQISVSRKMKKEKKL